MIKIGVISDTHGLLDNKISDFLETCDEIWHAGDIGKIEIYDRLSAWKPLKAVYGNIDDHTIRRTIPETLRFKCENKNVLITHIAGYPNKYYHHIYEMLKDEKIDILVCGHSHILKVMYDKKHNHLHINPGAAGKNGFHKFRTAIRFDISGNDISNMEILELPR